MATISHQKLTTSTTSTNATCSATLRHRVHLHHQQQRLLQSAQPRTILLSFLLVSCLISINCASYGRQLSGLDRWREPEYRFSSADSRDETGSNLEDLLSRLTSPNVEKQQQQQSLGDQQFEGYYYGLPNDPPARDRQPELQYVEQLPNVDYNRRLAELLVDAKDLQQPQQQQQQQNQHIDISSPLYLLLDKSREPSDSEVVFGQKRFEPEAKNAGATLAGDPSSAYQLIEDDAAFGLDANKRQTEDETAGGKQQPANFTTLLEDESEEVEITNPTTTTSAPATTTTTTSSTGKDAALRSDKNIVEQKSYAQNITKSSGVKSSARSIEGTSLSSVLSDFYAKLSAYLPFTHQSSAVVESSINKQASSGGAAKQRVSDSTGKTISVGSHLGDDNGDEEEGANGVSYNYDKDTTDSGQVLKVHISRPVEENQRISLIRKSALSVPVADARDEPLPFKQADNELIT